MDAKIERLLRWAEGNGANLKDLDVHYEENSGIGVYAKQDIQAGQVLASIPESIIITESVTSKALDPLLTSRDLGTFAKMCLFLVYEKHVRGPASFWASYIDCLPESFSTTVWYNDEELRYLGGTPLEYFTALRKKKYQDDWEAARASVREQDVPAAALTWDSYLWAVSVYTTRAFPDRLLPSAQGRPEIGDETRQGREILLPVLDLFNHRPRQCITWETTNTGIRFINSNPIKVGEQVFSNYGPKSNHELLLNYGFCFPDNQHDVYHLHLNYSRDPDATEKEQMLRNVGVEGNDLYVPRQGLDSAGIIPAMRIIAMNKVEFGEYCQRHAELREAERVCFMSVRNELAAVSLLETQLYAKYRSLIDADSSLPQSSASSATITAGGDSNISCNAQNALLYRKGIREILEKTISDIKSHEIALLARIGDIVNSNDPSDLIPGYLVGRDQLNLESLRHCPVSKYAAALYTAPAGVKATPDLVSRAILTQDSFRHDAKFHGAVQSLDFDSDFSLILFLIRCRYRKSSPWYNLLNLYKTVIPPDQVQEASLEELRELVDQLDEIIPAISEAFPKLFPLSKFTRPNIVWAARLMQLFYLQAVIAGQLRTGLCLA